MAEHQRSNMRTEQGELFPELKPPVWALEGRVSPAGYVLTVPNLSQAPDDWPHAMWLRTDCRECGQFSEWVLTAEDGNGWDTLHSEQTGHHSFYSFCLSRIQYLLVAGFQ